MLKSEEMLVKINNKIEECKSLEGQAKSDLFDEIKNLKKDYEIQKELEVSEVKEIENKIDLRKEDVKMDNKERMELINKEEKIFENYIRSTIANDMTSGGNGAIIPTTISSRIIERVKEIAPVYARATKFTVGGDLVFPKESSIPTCAYVDEMAVVTATDATFTTVKLQSFIAGVLSKVSNSLINRSDFDIVTYVVNAIAKSIAEFLEKELIVGTAGKAQGVVSTTNAITTASATAIVADELIDLQMSVKQALQPNCEFLMNPTTLKALRKLKDLDGNYLLQRDISQAFGFTLLGKPVMLSDNMPAIAATKDVIVYGDFSGLYVKLANNVQTKILSEKYADQYAIGVVSHIEFDSKIVEDQKFAKLTMKA